MKLVVTLIALAALTPVCLAEDNAVLAPIYKDASLPEKMLVFIPGGKVPVANYVETAKAIQASSKAIRLWVVIPAVFQRLCIISCTASSVCAPLHSNVESALSEAAKQGWKRGTDSEDIFLAGHSLGGVCANTLLQAYSTSSSLPYKALVVMGSYVDETGAHDLPHYPVPVLTLNVELDGGLARPGKTATWWRQFIGVAADKGRDYALTNKPVVILPHLNHSDFCPGFDVPGDLLAEVSQADATALIGDMVAAFLSLHTEGVSSGTQRAALSLLDSKAQWTSSLMSPYLLAQDMERNATNTAVSAEGSSSFCAEAQKRVSGLSQSDAARVRVQDGFHVSSPNLEHCHPNWTHVGDGIVVDSCSHTDYYADVQNTGEITAASEIACKMLSGDRLAEQLNVTSYDKDVTCSSVNQWSVELAEMMAFSSTLDRYKRSGRGWCFLKDVPTYQNIGPLWVFKDALALKDNSTCMSVASPILKTAIDGKIYPGNHYCKFLSPARVLDWMMTDSLKPGK